jgi:hypothetical protein
MSSFLNFTFNSPLKWQNKATYQGRNRAHARRPRFHPQYPARHNTLPLL